MKDKGLFIVALLLLGVGVGVLAQDQIGLGGKKIVVPVTGAAVDVIGVCLIVGGIYFLYQSRK